MGLNAVNPEICQPIHDAFSVPGVYALTFWWVVFLKVRFHAMAV